MARFDVHEFRSSGVPLVLDVQANLLNDLNTRVVVPLFPHTKARLETAPKLKPVFQINNKTYVLMTTDMGTVHKAELGPGVVNLEQEYREIIVEALDFLFQGF